MSEKDGNIGKKARHRAWMVHELNGHNGAKPKIKILKLFSSEDATKQFNPEERERERQ